MLCYDIGYMGAAAGAAGGGGAAAAGVRGAHPHPHQRHPRRHPPRGAAQFIYIYI